MTKGSRATITLSNYSPRSPGSLDVCVCVCVCSSRYNKYSGDWLKTIRLGDIKHKHFQGGLYTLTYELKSALLHTFKQLLIFS